VSLVVRDAVEADADRLGRIKVAGWQAAYRGLLPDDALDQMDPPRIAAGFADGIAELRQLAAPDRVFLVATDDDVVVGYVVAGPYRWDEIPGAGEVYALYVDPDRWGSGAGRALMVAVEGRLQALGHPEAALWVLEANQVGRGFYEAVGWVADGASGERCEVDNAREVRYRRPL
jgi:GNAT superfamily N-acetyltransferase